MRDAVVGALIAFLAIGLVLAVLHDCPRVTQLLYGEPRIIHVLPPFILDASASD